MTTSHKVPGGTAKFRDPAKLSTAATRRVALASRHIPRSVLSARTVLVNGVEVEDVRETDLLGLPIDLTDADVEATWRFNDALILVLLESWTVKRPLPQDADDLGELPTDLYSELSAIAGKLQGDSAKKPDGFTVDAIEDPEAPTGA